jgi:NADH-quinone oxidoreductase subunit M
MLTLIVLLPFLAAIGLAFVPVNFRFVMRLVALATTLVVALLGLLLFWRFDTGAAGYQFVTTIPLLGTDALGIQCQLGVDGINLGLILMGTLVAFAAACVSWEIKEREKEFYILLLVMTGGILGAFASLDLFFFYFFHELALVPTFIMIGVWGRGENKNYATFQITLYLSLGALIALVGLIALYLQLPADQRTFDIREITDYFATHPMSESAQGFIYPLLMFGFGVLVSLWPFHTWAPLGYGSAPAGTAMLHAGVLKKFGLYGLIRVALPLLPQGAHAPLMPSHLFTHFPFWLLPASMQDWFQSLGALDCLALLCLGNILYCGFVAMRQKDLNLLIGNSSVAHMGFVFLGIASLSLVGVTGAVVVMVAHGFLAALMFGLSGYLYQQTRTLDLTQLSGLLPRLPFIGAALVMAMLAGCGLPGFANFVGEMMVLFGTWKSGLGSAQGLVVAVAWGGLIIGAVYMLRAVRDLLHGPVREDSESLADANSWRKLPFVVLLGSLLLFGFFPKLLTEKIKPSAALIVNMANSGNQKPPSDSPSGVIIVAAEGRPVGGAGTVWPRTVTVHSTNQSVFVVGEVQNPGRQNYQGNLTVLKAIEMAGGLTEFANRRVVTIVRDGAPEAIDDRPAKDRLELDRPVYPGDRITVAKRIF